jgi:MFS family permease
VHHAWLVLGAVALVMLAASGVRSAFGVFIKPMEEEFGWGRTSISVVASLSLLLYGAVGPLAGRFADRWGPRRVLAVSAVLIGAGALGTSTVVTLWQLYVTAGILTAIGAGGVGMSVAAAVAARWFEARRGLVLGIVGGGMAAGQLLIVPAAMALTMAWGWRWTFVAFGVGFLILIAPLILAFVWNDPGERGLAPYGAARGSAPPTARDIAAQRTGVAEASGTGPFWLLAGSFWVCGYTSSGLVLTHLIPHATEHGFHAAQAAQALGLMGALNVVGTVASGWICDRFGHKGPLAAYYFLRGLSLVFLPYVGTLPGLLAFAGVFGLNYISTVPPTTALTAKIYGRYSVGELSGWIFLSHQVGSAVGALVGGWLYDRLGDYTLAFHSAAALGFVAAGLVLAIREEPAPGRPVVAPAAGS